MNSTRLRIPEKTTALHAAKESTTAQAGGRGMKGYSTRVNIPPSTKRSAAKPPTHKTHTLGIFRHWLLRKLLLLLLIHLHRLTVLLFDGHKGSPFACDLELLTKANALSLNELIKTALVFRLHGDAVISLGRLNPPSAFFEILHCLPSSQLMDCRYVSNVRVMDRYVEFERAVRACSSQSDR
jgi:hypothetical protein